MFSNKSSKSTNSITCPICDSATEAYPANIAAFLVHVCRLEGPTTNTRYCRKCDFVFFERRLSNEEAGRLYHNYRGAEYNETRNQIEPGYVQLAVFMDDELGPYFVKRIDSYTNMMRLFPEIKVDRVLDFGGDGKLAKRVFTRSDVSFDDLSAGNQLSSDKFDLIFASQVFEHLSDVKKNIIDLSQKMDDDGVVIIDVPKEYTGSLSEGLLWQRKHGGALYIMHEHINHYSLRAIEELVKSAGLVPFFTVLPPHFRTILTMAGRPGSKVVAKLQSVSVERQLLWYAQQNLQNSVDAQVAAETANSEARASHFYARQVAERFK